MDSNQIKYKKSKLGFKISHQLIKSVFGFNVADKILKFNKKSELMYEINNRILEESQNMLKNKSKGFYHFVDFFIENLKDKSMEKNKELIMKIKNNLFNTNNTSLLSFTVYEANRYLISKNDEVFRLKVDNAIMIQKHIRRLLALKKFYDIFKDNLKQKINFCIVSIQKAFKMYRIGFKVRKYILILNILKARKSSLTKIKKLFTRKKNITKFNNDFLKRKIIEVRARSAILIQSKFRGYFMRKIYKLIDYKETNNYTLHYPFKAKYVKLKIYITDIDSDQKQRIYDFEYCKIREIFVLYINPSDFKTGKYRVQLIVDNCVTCDGRFPHVEFSDGLYYNIIDFRINKGHESGEQTKTNTHNNQIDFIYSDSNITIKSESSSKFKLNSSDIPEHEMDYNLRENLINQKAVSYFEILKQNVIDETIFDS